MKKRINITISLELFANYAIYYIYITKNERTANQSTTGLSRPVGNAMKNSSSTNSIPDSSKKINSFEKNSSEKVSSYDKLKAQNAEIAKFAEENIKENILNGLPSFIKNSIDISEFSIEPGDDVALKINNDVVKNRPCSYSP